MGPCATWDVTWNWKDEAKTTWMIFFGEYCKKWAFQKENGQKATEMNPEGYLHGQGRFVLTSKKLEHKVVELMKAYDLVDFRISQTTTHIARSGDLFYVLKKDTRVDGPWCDQDHLEKKVMTKQLEKITELYPWQSTMVEYLKTWDDRKIMCIIQPSGNCGKSGFAEYAEYHDLAYEIPPMNDMQDVMQCVLGIMKKHTWKAFMIDMPKAMKKEKLGPFYAGLETLKNGVAWDKRYAFQKMRFDRPLVIVFTNSLPDISLLSEDRWDFRKIEDLCLKPYYADELILNTVGGEF